MIPRDQLPEDAADWSGASIFWERLDLDCAASCPETEDQVFEYVRMESADSDDADRARLRFARTAQVGDSKYWLWEYTESDGQVCFVFLRVDPDGSILLGLADANGLSHAQFLLADYYDEIYWS